MKTTQQRKQETKRVNVTQRIRVKEAVEFHNSTVEKKKDKLNMFDLAQRVIHRDILTSSKYQLLCQYNSGSEECPHNYVVKIATITGVTTDYLLGMSDNTTVESELTKLLMKVQKTNQ